MPAAASELSGRTRVGRFVHAGQILETGMFTGEKLVKIFETIRDSDLNKWRGATNRSLRHRSARPCQHWESRNMFRP